jgi:hypothetical protein
LGETGFQTSKVDIIYCHLCAVVRNLKKHLCVRSRRTAG